MPGATTGLKAALARSASGSVVALAEMTAEDLIAGMTDEQKTALAASLTPPAAAASATAGTGGEAEEEAEAGAEAEAAAAAATANASERDRVKAVAAAVATDETCKGKADLALSMLADDDFAGLNAAAMVKMIGKSGVAAEASDDAALAEMKAAIAETGNSGIDASGGKVTDKAAQSASVWDKAIARVFPTTPAN